MIENVDTETRIMDLLTARIREHPKEFCFDDLLWAPVFDYIVRANCLSKSNYSKLLSMILDTYNEHVLQRVIANFDFNHKTKIPKAPTEHLEELYRLVVLTITNPELLPDYNYTRSVALATASIAKAINKELLTKIWS